MPSASGSYTYDSGGQLTSIPGVISEITYNANQDPVRMVFSNGVSTDYTYDGDRLWLLGSQTSAGVTALFDETYTRDDMGRMTKVRSNRSKGNWDYAYDELDQLLSATNLDDAALTQSFTYDEAGNMTYNSALGSYSYPAATAPRPHAPTDVAGQALTYDRNGNMLSGMGRTIVYDAADRPVTVTANGQTTTYVYGPDDKRLKKVTGGNTTLYLGDDEEHLSDGTVIKHIDGMVRRVGSVSNWIHRDHLSSVRLMTDATGTQIAENRYRPYGERTDVQLAVNTPRESRGWIGERDDPETGLTYLNARYYDPALGRFITPDWFDPTGPGVGTNRYAYGMNNPIMLKDPSGNRVSDVGPLGRLGGDEANTASNSLHDNGMSVPGDAVSDLAANTGFGRPFDEEEEEYQVAKYGKFSRELAKKFPRTFGPIDKNLRYADKQISRFVNRNVNNPLRELSKKLFGGIGKSSRTARKAALYVRSWTPKNKHLLGSKAKRSAKFNTNNIKEVQNYVREALLSDRAQFMTNNVSGSFRVVTDLGRQISSKGQTSIRVVVGKDGKIWNAFPVNLK